MNKIRTFSLAAISLATALTLSACSGGGSMPGMDMGEGQQAQPSASASASAEFNEADIAFAQMMIPHHQSAMDMADVVLAKEGIDQRVLDLATQIKEAQGPEITQLQGWLAEWGADESMPGMDMSEMDMGELEAATGVDAAKMFLEQMKVHHQGAITMAQTQVETGANPDAIAMAESIVSSQTEEIATIDEILPTL